MEVHHREWQEAVRVVTRAYQPKGEIPLFLLAHLVDKAAGIARLV